MSTLPREPGSGAIDLLAAWREIGDGTAGALELDTEVDCILVEVSHLGFELGAVSLVDDYRRVIETFRGWNIPSGWTKRAKHSLDSVAGKKHDIQADVVHTKETVRVTGWDDRLDREIYERFEHSRLSRIFVPILDGETVVGTIEAGCSIDRTSVVLTEENIQKVERLGRERGSAIARTRPSVLLRLIAEKTAEAIGADSASLHVYQAGTLLLMAGSGFASGDLLGAFSPERTGAVRVMPHARLPLVINLSQNPALSSELSRFRVRTVAAFPLSLVGNCYGVVSLYFCGEQKINAAALDLGALFVRQMDVAIQNSLLLKELAATAGLAWNLSSFQSVIRSLASNRSLSQVLSEVASSILNMLDADSITLYQFFENEGTFGHPPVTKGFFREPGLMSTPMRRDGIVWTLVQRGQSRFAADVSEDPMFTSVSETKRTRFAQREGIRSCAAMVLKPGLSNEIVGCLFVNYRTPTNFSPEDKRVISALASSVAIAIQTARLHAQIDRDLKRRGEQLEGLRAVDNAIVSNASDPHLQTVLNVVLEQVVKITGAESGQVMRFNRWNANLERRAQLGFPDDARIYDLPLGKGTIGQVAEERTSRLFSTGTDWQQEIKAGSVPPRTQTQIVVPLVDPSGLLGVLSVEHSHSGAFKSDDTALLEGFAVQAVIAVHTFNLYEQLQHQIKPLRALTAIAGRSHDARSDLETNLRMLLSGVTAGQGLGLSRAMLFRIDKDRKNLRGWMAIGGQTREEAEGAWDKLKRETPKDFAGLLDEVARFSKYVQNGGEDSPLSIAVKRILLPLERASGAPAVCAIEDRPIVIAYGQDDPVRNVLARVSKGDRGHAVICVPLMGRGEETGQAIGVLLCDNRFLLNEREIDPECVKGIQAFADVAAMSIENDRLRANVDDEKRLDAWRDAALRIAHRLKTRVYSISEGLKQTSRRLGELARANNVDEIENLRSEMASIEEVKQTLSEFELFGAPPSLCSDQLDLAELLQEVTQQHSSWIKLERPNEPALMRGDRRRLSDVFLELIHNAQDAMKSIDPPMMTITVGVEDVKSEGRRITVQVADAGPGIPDDKKVWIFTPFNTMKREIGGTGMGLAIVEEYVREHKGTIEETGTPGQGACFVLRFPAFQNR